VDLFYGTGGMVFKHSRDTTILIALATVVYIIVYYSNLFQYYFYQSTIVPTLVENSCILVYKKTRIFIQRSPAPLNMHIFQKD